MGSATGFDLLAKVNKLLAIFNIQPDSLSKDFAVDWPATVAEKLKILTQLIFCLCRRHSEQINWSVCTKQ